MPLIAAVSVVLLMSLALPYVLRPLLVRLGVVDIPNERSSHQSPTLRGVGLAPLLAVTVGFVIVMLWPSESAGRATVGVILAVTAVSGLLGLVEDVRGIPVALRAAAQLLVGAAGSVAVILLSSDSWWLLPVFAIAIAAYINVANFMDGVDGISGLHGVIVGATYAVLGVLAELPWLTMAGLILAMALAGFLPWNVFGKRVFLGDVGSYFLGGCIAIVAVTAIAQGVPVLAAVSPLTIYLADTGVTLIRRMLRGERWYEAHRTHVYQRLTDRGLSHLSVSLVVAGASLMTSALGLLALVGPPSLALASGAAIVIIAGLYVALPRLLKGEAPSSDVVAIPDSDLPVPAREFKAKSWAVLGASGFIGSAVVAALRARDLDVLEVRAPRLEYRPSASSDHTGEALAQHEAEIEALAKVFSGADVVVNAAGRASPDSPASASLYGANSLLPVLVATAAKRAKVSRLVHMSSAAVQGRRSILDESRSTSAFSPYSRSKALGEAGLLSWIEAENHDAPELVIVRATSVQGPGRATTQQLRRLAKSRVSSVASPGDRPTVVSSLRGLVDFIVEVGARKESIPTIVLQPWEGLTTAAILEVAGGRPPRKLPAVLCHSLIFAAYAIGVVAPPLRGLARRVEMTWFGQGQDAGWARSAGLEGYSHVAEVFATEPVTR